MLVEICGMTNLTQHPLFARLAHQPVMRELHVSEEVHTLMVFHQMDFVWMQFKLQFFLQKLLYRSKQVFQLRFVSRHKYKIVGVADIVFCFQLMFYKLVELVHVHVGKKLRGQIADGYAARMEQVGIPTRKAADDLPHKPHDLWILTASRQYFQQYFMVDTVKKLSHVALQCIAGARAIEADRAEHLRQPLYAFVAAFADAARKGVGYESWLKNRIEHFKDSVMQHSVAHYCFVDVPQLGIGDIKAGVLAMLVGFVSEVVVQLENMLLQFLFKFHDIVLAPFVLLELIPCAEQMLDRGHALEYLLVRFHNYD